jgi:hypothetical protein
MCVYCVYVRVCLFVPVVVMSCCPPGSHGYLHSGGYTPEGKIVTAGSTELYATGSAGPNAVLLVPVPAPAARSAVALVSVWSCIHCPQDVFGWNGGRTRAIADHLARHGAAPHARRTQHTSTVQQHPTAQQQRVWQASATW